MMGLHVASVSVVAVLLVVAAPSVAQVDEEQIQEIREMLADPERVAALEAQGVDPARIQEMRRLVQNADRVVTKDELLDTLWPGVAVSEGSLTRAMNVLRTTLGDSRGEGDLVETLRGRGYRLAVAVERGFGSSAVPGNEMPKSACFDSPGPFTIHPITATVRSSTPGNSRLHAGIFSRM